MYKHLHTGPENTSGSVENSNADEGGTTGTEMSLDKTNHLAKDNEGVSVPVSIEIDAYNYKDLDLNEFGNYKNDGEKKACLFLPLK